MIFLRSTDQVSTWRQERYDPAYNYLLYYFNTICPRPKNWTFGVLGRPRPGCGTMRPRYGTSREIRNVPGNTGRLATKLYLHMTSFCSSRIATLFALIAFKSGGPLNILDHETTVGLTDRLYQLTVLRQITIL